MSPWIATIPPEYAGGRLQEAYATQEANDCTVRHVEEVAAITAETGAVADSFPVKFRRARSAPQPIGDLEESQ
jgi:hypothetical protein